MTDIDNFVDACRDNNITLARHLLASVDINGRDSSDGWTGLMWAMLNNHLPIVRMLLNHPNILVGTTNIGNNTALHLACYGNREECVRLFLAHQQCTPGIVNTVDSDGNTAEMVATRKGYHGCARIIRDYINNSQASSSSTGASSAVNPAPLSSPARPTAPPPPATRSPPPSARPGRLTLAQLAKAIENIEEEKKTFIEETTAEINSLQEKWNDVLNNQKNGLAEMENRREALRAELHQRTGEEAAGNIPPASLIPECPCCYESLLEMRPPKQILTCGNGHLICSDCQPEITGNRCISRCGSSYGGRATAMEQMVRQILGIM